jgi:hypothetical protein
VVEVTTEVMMVEMVEMAVTVAMARCIYNL